MSWDSTTPSNAEYPYTGDSLVPTGYDFTLVQWIKVQTLGDLDALYSIGTPSPEQHWGVRLRTTGGDIQIEGWDGNNPAPTLQFSDSTTLVGEWKVYITCWKANGSDADVWMALNGESNANHTETITTFTPSPTSPEFRLGVNRAASSGRVLDGWHSAAALYNRELTNAEQASHYVSAEKGVYPFHVAEDALLGCWMIDGDLTKALHSVGVDLSEQGTLSYDTADNPTFINRITRSNFAGF
jgi:hypothetical protein